MQRTANLDLPYILPSQAQKHVTHNEAIRALDAIVQLCVRDADRTSPPETPQEGDRHIVAPGAEGEWAGQDQKIAAWQDGAWMIYAPLPGWLAFVEAQGELLAYHAGAWHFAGGEIARLQCLSIQGAAADSYNRLALNASGSLFNHDGAGHRMVINKSDSAETASLLFQAGFSGRAELGLAGDDLWRLKVSADGVNWREALTVPPEGPIAFGGPLRLASFVLNALPDPAEAGPGAMIYLSDEAGGAAPVFSDGTAWRRISDQAVVS